MAAGSSAAEECDYLHAGCSPVGAESVQDMEAEASLSATPTNSNGGVFFMRVKHGET